MAYAMLEVVRSSNFVFTIIIIFNSIGSTRGRYCGRRPKFMSVRSKSRSAHSGSRRRLYLPDLQRSSHNVTLVNENIHAYVSLASLA